LSDIFCNGIKRIELYALSGGATDKFGNHYEGRWTVACMIEVIDGADSIRLEPPGKEGEGVEFICERRQP